MTSGHKFDYAVDHGHTLIVKAHKIESFLSSLCPILVGKLRAEAEKQSSSRLLVQLQKFARNAMLASLLGLKQEAAEAHLFLAISLDTLANRYRTRTLEPELHAGNSESIAWADSQLELEDAQQQDSEPVAVSEVNAASDGIA
jgi:hypothetical protein